MNSLQVLAELMASCLLWGALLASMFIPPTFWRALANIGGAVLSIVAGVVYDVYLLLCSLLMPRRRIR